MAPSTGGPTGGCLRRVKVRHREKVDYQGGWSTAKVSVCVDLKSSDDTHFREDRHFCLKWNSETLFLNFIYGN